MMHDGRKVVEGTPAEIRANEIVHDLYLGSRFHEERRSERDARSRSRGSTRSTAARRRSRTSRFTMGIEAVAVIGRNGMGKTTLCNAIMGDRAAGCARLDPLPRRRSCSASPRTRSPRRGIGYVPQGRRLFPSLSTDEHLKMIRTPRGGRWTPGGRVRALPAPRRAQADLRDPALRRRAADARDRARAAHEPAAARSWTSRPRGSRRRSSSR